MNTKRRALGVCITVIIVLSCTLATVSAAYKFEMSKTVWDPDTSTYVDEIDAQVGDIVTFSVNFTCENVSQLCDLQLYSEGYEFRPYEDADYGDDIFILLGMINDTHESNDIYYWNATRTYEIVGCGEGINYAEMVAYCWDDGLYKEYIEVDRINDTATVNVECPEVPALTPLGLISLVGLLSAIAAVAIIRKRR